VALGVHVGMRNRLLVKFFALFCASFIAGVVFLHSTTRLKTPVVSDPLPSLVMYHFRSTSRRC